MADRMEQKWVDEGWSRMKTILDREMPVDTRRRRFFAWWWLGLVPLILAGAIFIVDWSPEERHPAEQGVKPVEATFNPDQPSAVAGAEKNEEEAEKTLAESIPPANDERGEKPARGEAPVSMDVTGDESLVKEDPPQAIEEGNVVPEPILTMENEQDRARLFYEVTGLKTILPLHLASPARALPELAISSIDIQSSRGHRLQIGLSTGYVVGLDSRFSGWQGRLSGRNALFDKIFLDWGAHVHFLKGDLPRITRHVEWADPATVDPGTGFSTSQQVEFQLGATQERHFTFIGADLGLGYRFGKNVTLSAGMRYAYCLGQESSDFSEANQAIEDASGQPSRDPAQGLAVDFFEPHQWGAYSALQYRFHKDLHVGVEWYMPLRDFQTFEGTNALRRLDHLAIQLGWRF
jgi:hypothetical protein